MGSRPFLYIAVITIALLGIMGQTLAHEMLPASLQEYIDSNPQATMEHIQSWIDAQDEAAHAAMPERSQDLLDAVREKKGFFANAADFTALGMEHIFTGTDHILFLIASILTFVSLKEIMKLTGTFTLAHSIALIFAGTLLLTLSSRIVEPVIAFSIAYVAIATVLLKKSDTAGIRTKLAMIFLFGLIHGMGFAGSLADIHIPKERFISSLLFFNVGIEIGQVILLVILVPILLMIRSSKWNKPFIRTAAAAISIIGIYWGAQRLLG